MEMLVRSLSQFPNYSFSVQIICASLFWLLLAFLADFALTSFAIKGYFLEIFQLQECWPLLWPFLSLSVTLLATYLGVLIVLSAKLAHHAVQQFIESRTLWQVADSQSLSIPSLNHASKLYLRDLVERELNLRASNVTSLIIKWYSEISDNEEFTKELSSQIEDIVSLLITKLSNIEVETFLNNLIFIVHSHLREYLIALKAFKNSKKATVVDHFHFSHPVSRGEIPLESYLNCQSEVVLQEYILGSVQDCHSVYSLICAAFSSQVLFKLVNHLTKPENILEPIVRMLDSIPKATGQENFSATDTAPVDTAVNLNQHILKNSLEESLPVYQAHESLISETHSDGSDEDEKECLSLPDEEEWSGNRNGSPILAEGFNSQPIAESCVKTGLSLTLSMLTAPLVPQCGELHSCEESPLELGPEVAVNQQGPRKPNSLPVISSDGVEGSKTHLSVEDVSPVYEDVEDFATAIAKLRSLLEQRELNGTDPRNTTSSPDARISCMSGETEGSFEELTEASEIPTDSRIFLSIRIPRTELITQGSEGQHSVYCITYDGIYTAISSTRADDNSIMKTDTRLVLKCRTVRRRFRQFLQLHEQLERSDNPMIQQAMRTIRGPSKWLNLPFSRLDQNTVAHRRMFLERYLQQLCSSVHIGTSIELRLFLEYELHANDMGSSNSAPSPRVPFLAKTVSVLQSIKTALPGFDAPDQANPVQLIPLPPPTPSAHSDSLGDRDCFNYKLSSTAPAADEVDTDFKCNVAIGTEISSLEQLLSTYVSRIDSRIESAYEAVELHFGRCETNVHEHETEFKENAQPTQQQLNSSVVYPVSEDGWDRFDKILPISSSLINLMFECLSHRETWLTRAPIPFATKVFFGHWMETKIQARIREWADPDKLSDNVKLLRQKLKERTLREQDAAAGPPKEKDIGALHLKVVELLHARIPGLVSLIVGRDLCSETLTAVISCLTHTQLNRDLALTFLDFFLSQISTSIQY